MNTQRARWAEKALLAYQKETGCDFGFMLQDLLGDLRHYADRHKILFDQALERSEQIYQDERRYPERPIAKS